MEALGYKVCSRLDDTQKRKEKLRYMRTTEYLFVVFHHLYSIYSNIPTLSINNNVNTCFASY